MDYDECSNDSDDDESAASRVLFSLPHRVSGPAYVRPGEYKFVDVNISTTSCVFNDAGSVTRVGGVSLGTTGNERVGKRIYLRSLQWRIWVKSAANLVSVNSLLFVYDRNCGFNGNALPAVTDILVDRSPYALNNPDYAARFVILKRIDFVLSGHLSSTTIPIPDTSQKLLTGFLDLGGLLQEYNLSTSGLYVTTRIGALLVLAVGTVSQLQTGAWPIVNGNIRNRFTDPTNPSEREWDT